MRIIFLLLAMSPTTFSLDPLSWGMVAGAGVFTSFLYSSYDQIKVGKNVPSSITKYAAVFLYGLYLKSE